MKQGTRRAKYWCFGCDASLVSAGTKCKNCGFRANKKKEKNVNHFENMDDTHTTTQNPTILSRASKNGSSPVNMQPSSMGGVFLEGITKREYFAILILQGLCSDLDNTQRYPNLTERAVDLADSLLITLEE